jgi:hypothetical protein
MHLRALFKKLVVCRIPALFLSSGRKTGDACLELSDNTFPTTREVQDEKLNNECHTFKFLINQSGDKDD